MSFAVIYSHPQKGGISMKKIVLRICSLALVLSLLTAPASAFGMDAASITALPGNSNTELQPLADSAPTEFRTLPYYPSIQNLPEQCGSYTICYFAATGTDIRVTGNVTATGDQNETSRKIKVQLYEVNGGVIAASETVAFLGTGTIDVTFKNLSANKMYYVRFFNATSKNYFRDYFIDGNFSIT